MIPALRRGAAAPTSKTAWHISRGFVSAFLLLAGLSFFAGCATPAAPVAAAPSEPPVARLHPGDTVRISFPGMQAGGPVQETTQPIRPDGRLSLYLVGDVVAAGKTIPQLEQELTQLYTRHIVASQVTVTLVSTVYAVTVTGAVIAPGELRPERTLTAFEAVMRASGYDPAKANLRKTTVFRVEGGVTKRIPVDLQAVLDGKTSDAVVLQSGDIVHVPEKFSWF